MLKTVIQLALVSVVLLQAGCQSTPERPLSEADEARFDPKGHIEKQAKPPQKADSPIPALSAFEPFNPEPTELVEPDLYSVSALNVPVQALLLRLAEDAGKEFDIHSGVQGQVTLNAIDQPLKQILKRIVAQVDAVYTLEHNAVVVRPDRPFWETYDIDYVNIIKNIQDTTVMNMSVGNVADSNSNNQSGNSEFRLETSVEHGFWASLEQSIRAMVAPRSEASAPTPPPPAPETEAQDQAAGSDTNAASSEAADQARRVVVHKESGLISAYATQKSQQQIAQYLAQLTERTNRQVLIEATVVEVELNDEYQAGIDWSVLDQSDNTSSNVARSVVGNTSSVDSNINIDLMRFNWDFDLGIRFLERFGDAKVLSSPKIMAMNNQTALLKVVKNEVYFTLEVNREAATSTSAGVTTFETNLHSVPVGFMMHVTPFINQDNVTLNVRPTLTSIVGTKSDPNPELAAANVESLIPVIREREMDSVLRLLDQQTAVIGGLIQDSVDDVESGVPGLRDLPFVGPAFDYQEQVQRKSELIIFIRPTIVKNPDIDHGDLQSLQPFVRTERMQNPSEKSQYDYEHDSVLAP